MNQKFGNFLVGKAYFLISFIFYLAIFYNMSFLLGYLFDVTGRPLEALVTFGVLQLIGGVFLMCIPIAQHSSPHNTKTETHVWHCAAGGSRGEGGGRLVGLGRKTVNRPWEGAGGWDAVIKTMPFWRTKTTAGQIVKLYVDIWTRLQGHLWCCPLFRAESNNW